MIYRKCILRTVPEASEKPDTLYMLPSINPSQQPHEVDITISILYTKKQRHRRVYGRRNVTVVNVAPDSQGKLYDVTLSLLPASSFGGLDTP